MKIGQKFLGIQYEDKNQFLIHKSNLNETDVFQKVKKKQEIEISFSIYIF